MATKEIAVKLTVDGGKSVKELKTVEESLNEIEKGLRNISKVDAVSKATKNFNNLNKIVDESALSVQDMTKAMENYVNIAATAGRTSPLGKEAIKKAGQMKDKIDGLSTELQQAAKDGQNLQAALQMGTTVIAGYTAFQSTVALMGVESEALTETFVKLQAAQGLLMSVESLRQSLEKEGILVTKLTAFWTAVQTKATAMQSKAKKKDIAVTGLVTAAQWLWNAALAANPVVLIIIAVAALVAGLVTLAVVLGDTGDGFDKAAEQERELNAAILEGNLANNAQKTSLESLIAVANDETASQKARNQAIKEAIKMSPEHLGNLTLENIATEEGTTAIEGYIEALNRKAQAQAIQESLVQKNKELLELEAKSLEEFASGFDWVVENIAQKIDVTGIGKSLEDALGGEEIKAKDRKKIQEESIALKKKEIEAVKDLLKEKNKATLEDTSDADAFAKSEEARKKSEADALAAANKASADRKKTKEQADKDAEADEAERVSNEIAAQEFVDNLKLELLTEGLAKQEAVRTKAFENQIGKLEADGQLTNESQKLLTKQLEDDLLQIRAEAAEAVAAQDKEIADKRAALRVELMEEGFEKEAEASEVMFYAELELLREQGVLTEELEAELLEGQEQKLEEIRDKWRKVQKAKDKTALDEKLAAINDSINKASSLVESFGKINKNITEVQLNNAKGNAAKQEEIQRKSFEREKKVNIARALIAGAQAALQSIKLFGPPPSPLGIAGLVAAGVVTATSIAAIKSAQFQSSGGSTVPSGASSITPPPPPEGNANDDTTTETAGLIGETAGSTLAVSAVDMSNVQENTKMIQVIQTL